MAERGPQYFTERGPRSAGRSPSVERPGLFVSRREHQKEIGQPLPPEQRFRQRLAVSKRGNERRVYVRGYRGKHRLGEHVGLSAVIAQLKRLEPLVAADNRLELLFAIQYLNPYGQVQFNEFGPIKLDELLDTAREILANGGDTIDLYRELLNLGFGTDKVAVATGAVQMMLLPRVEERGAA